MARGEIMKQQNLKELIAALGRINEDIDNEAPPQYYIRTHLDNDFHEVVVSGNAKGLFC
jgi:hypothetical protein